MSIPKAPKISKIPLAKIAGLRPVSPSSFQTQSPLSTLPDPSSVQSIQTPTDSLPAPLPVPTSDAPQMPQAPQPALGTQALQTEPSNLEKLLDVLNKPGAIERQIAVNAIKGDALDTNVAQIAGWQSGAPLLSNLNNLISANNAYQPAGSDILKALNDGQDWDGGSTFGKIAQAVGGFGVEALNPLDPFNWLGFGEVTDAGRLAQEAGEAKPFIQGLLNGERSIASIHPFSSLATPFIPGATDALSGLTLHAPQGANDIAGTALQGVGNLAMAVPGVPQLVKAFTPTFSKLANYATQVTDTARDFVGKTLGPAAQAGLDKLYQEGLPEIAENAAERSGNQANHLSQVNPQQWAYYKNLDQKTGLPLPANDLNFAKPLTDQEVQDHEIQRGLSMGEEFKGRSSEPKDLVDYVESKVPTKGPLTPKIKEFVDKLAPVYPAYKKALKQANYRMSFLGDSYTPHATSQALKDSLEEQGVQLTGGKRTSSKSFTPEEANFLFRTAQGRAKLFAKFGTEGFQDQPKALDAFSRKEPATADAYNFNAKETALSKAKSTGQKIGVANALDSMMKDPTIMRANQSDWFGSPEELGRNAVPVDLPPQFNKINDLNFKGRNNPNEDKKLLTGNRRVWVPQDTAHEFRNFLDIFTDADKANNSLGAAGKAWQGLTRTFKGLTILAPPAAFHTAGRDNFANNILSMIAHAWSWTGYKTSLQITKALFDKNPEKLKAVLKELSERTGLDMEQEYKLAKESGVLDEGFTHGMFDEKPFNKFEKYTGMEAVAKLRNLSENQTRLQHYFTRRLQRWSPKGAIQDTRKVLYDYVHGLSPLDRHMANVFPFWAWSRFNIPAMFEAALKHPGEVGSFYRAKENIEHSQSNAPDERALDEYVKGDPHIRLFQDGKGNWTYLRLKGFLPQADLEDITSFPKFTDLLEGSLNPLIKTPLENTMNASTFFKTAGGQPAPIEEFPGQTGKFLGLDLGRKTINALKDIRPLNEINRLAGMVGGQNVSGKPASLNPVNYGISTLGASLVPINTANAIQHAKGSYLRQLSQLKIAKRREEEAGKPTTDVDALMQQLSQNAYTVGR